MTYGAWRRTRNETSISNLLGIGDLGAMVASLDDDGNGRGR